MPNRHGKLPVHRKGKAFHEFAKEIRHVINEAVGYMAGGCSFEADTVKFGWIVPDMKSNQVVRTQEKIVRQLRQSGKMDEQMAVCVNVIDGLGSIRVEVYRWN